MASTKTSLPKRASVHLAYRLSRLRQDLSRSLMRRRRRKFAALPPNRLRLPKSPTPLPGVEVFSLLCERDVPEETLSFLSFLHHVGLPTKWTIVSDGSLTDRSREFFAALHPCLQIRSWTEFVTPLNRGSVEPFAAMHPMGKKLAIMSSLPAEGVSLYIDSDILFFPRASELRELLLNGARGHCFYMPDPYPAKGPPLRPEEIKPEPGINAGFVIQGCAVDWKEALRRTEALLVGEPDQRALFRKYLHIVEQTITHLALSAQGARPLGPEYCVTNDDLLNFFDTASRRSLVARHYIWVLKPHMWHHSARYCR